MCVERIMSQYCSLSSWLRFVSRSSFH